MTGPAPTVRDHSQAVMRMQAGIKFSPAPAFSADRVRGRRPARLDAWDRQQ